MDVEAATLQLSPTMMRYIEELAAQSSIRRAAERLNVSASSVNRQLLGLEEQLGIELFERLSRGIRITEAGRIVLATVRRFRADAESAVGTIEALRSHRGGRVGFGTILYLSEAYVPALLAEVRKVSPTTSTLAFFGNSQDIVSRVVDGRLDIGLCWDPSPSAPIERRARCAVPLGVVCRPDHPLAAGPGIRLRDLHDTPVAFPVPGTDLRNLLDAMNVGVGRSISPAIETNSMAMMRRLALDGVAVAIVTAGAVDRDLRDGTLVFRSLDEPGMQTMTLSLFVASGRTLPPAVSVLLTMIEADWGTLTETMRHPFHSVAGE